MKNLLWMMVALVLGIFAAPLFEIGPRLQDTPGTVILEEKAEAEQPTVEAPKPCCEVTEAEHAAASSLMAKQLVWAKAGPALPVGPVPKVGDTCPNCKGAGKVGDGTVFRPCPKCGADGKIDEGDLANWGSAEKSVNTDLSPVAQPSLCGCPDCTCEDCRCNDPQPSEPQEKVAPPTIICYTYQGCYWCDVWKQREAVGLAGVGWTIRYEPSPPGMMAPWFQILQPGQPMVTVKEYLTYRKLRQATGLR